MHFRHIYNNTENTKLIVLNCHFIYRNFAYSGMFRYNSKGDFNVLYRHCIQQ